MREKRRREGWRERVEWERERERERNFGHSNIFGDTKMVQLL